MTKPKSPSHNVRGGILSDAGRYQPNVAWSDDVPGSCLACNYLETPPFVLDANASRTQGGLRSRLKPVLSPGAPGRRAGLEQETAKHAMSRRDI